MDSSAQVAPTFPRWTAGILKAACFYYLACGLSALFVPSLWWQAAGLPPQTVPLLMEVIGTLMLSLSVGAYFASSNPVQHWVVILVILLACLLDGLAVLSGVWGNSLPTLNGVGLIVLDLFWVVVLSLVLKATKKQHL